MFEAGFMDFYVIFDAVDPATGSVFSFQTLLREEGRQDQLGVRLFLRNLVSRFTPPPCKTLSSGLTLFNERSSKLTVLEIR